MSDVKPLPLTDSLGFRLGVLGAVVMEQFAHRLVEHDLKPKHAGLLALLELGGPSSQLDLARTMRVAPSLMVSLVDHLEGLGALQRIRDPADRRRQVVSITPIGGQLLATCAAAAREIDDAISVPLSGAQRLALRESLGMVLRHVNGSFSGG